MAGPLTFPADSADRIERAWWPKLSNSFPYYATFWETFVGLKDPAKPFRPYGLVFPGSTPKNIRRRVSRAYLGITQFHYSLFCEIAGAHFQLEAVEAAYQLPVDDRIFRFLEAFNGFYDHLGTAKNMECGVWVKSGVLARAIDPQGATSARSLTKPIEFIRAELGASAKTSLIGDLDLLNDQAIRIRNHHVHNIGARFSLVGGRYVFVLSVAEAEELRRKTGMRITEEESVKRMTRHLGTMERFLDGSERVLGQALGAALASAGINVDY